MEALVKKRDNFQKWKNGFEPLGGNVNGGAAESLTDSSAEPKEKSVSSGSRSETPTEDVKAKGSSSPAPLGWPILKASGCKSYVADLDEYKQKSQEDDSSKYSNMGSKISEIDMMKERFAKLLLGEDMSGSGKGVCTALAISNAITNLCATIFGQLWRLEPLPSEKKAMWRREMEWLLCLSHHIVELIPNWQTFPDGSKLEVMNCRPRSDLFINLPALRKLDNMLFEILDSFTSTEFWYVDQGVIAPDSDGSASLCKTIQRQDEKWWLPVPRVPAGGLSENSRKQLHNTRECTSQILKAAMVINSITLAEMEVPESFLQGLPKNGRACLGDVIYRYITSDQFSSDCLLDCLDISSEHVALEVANRIEASIYVWRRRANSKPPTHPSRSTTKSSWDMVKDLMVDGDKRELLAERAESLLLCLKQRFPCLTQTTLDTSKIHCNKDVGKSILESYSRVLESLAFNIVARIDDVLYVDNLSKHSDKMSPVSKVSVVTHKKVSLPYSVPVSSTTPSKTASTAPSISPAPLISPAMVERAHFLHNNIDHKPPHRGFGVKRVLSNYLGVDTKAKICGSQTEGRASTPKTDIKDCDSSVLQNATNRISIQK